MKREKNKSRKIRAILFGKSAAAAAAQGQAGEARDLRDGWKRAEKRLILAQREISRLRAELDEAERGEQLRREAWFQLLDEKDEEIRRLKRALEAAGTRKPQI